MNRSIKFRAWVAGKMVQLDGLDFNVGTSTLTGRIHGDPEKVVSGGSVEYMQFIGLLDKNGKEIYEGDVVQDGPYLFKVIWDKYCWNLEGFYCSYFDYPSLAFSEYNFSDKAGVFEIVGNVWENPQLLKV